MNVQTAALVLSAVLHTVWGQSPVASIRPRTAAVKLGETVSFTCRVTSGSQSLQLEWKRTNNQPLGDNVKLGPDGAVLTITSVRLSNQGGYRCIATNAQGKGTATASLTIRQPPKVRVTPSGPLSVRAGESVTLECRVTGKPRPSISWTKQGGEAELVSTTTDTTASLQVTVLSAEDAGIFVCRAQSREGLAEGRVELRMEGGASGGAFPQASVTETDLKAEEGQSISMHCHATGSPTPVISWSKLRAPLPWQHKVNGGILTLNNVGRQDSGQYICNATSALGFSEAYVQLEVDSPPYATTLTEETVARPGDALRLQCLAHGSHPIRFRWTRVGGASMPPGAETTKDGLLKIAQLKVLDSGTYKCVATNHVGSSEALTKVTVRA
ncbi:basement membrane-specific heparan sulfate proteoglycan core protein-like [Sinocyclocheilus grahami]|uniref:Basement membrane-specific heparan sulfate proteoglycan core protein-like n=1 Tax=Sinocyclocheilus grahami TaxID=75366 RepID=A0A672KL05_SINGR|nr:PREDICTED: basement membrane-specific heparan sulfate proteoglycan core protein-like [Sinocyclocheilus grahami]